MKTVLSFVCMIGMVVLLSSCKGDDNGSSGGNGDFPTVSFQKTTNSAGEEVAVCYNADTNVITTQQVCTWRCAYYLSDPRWVQLTFNNALVCQVTGVDANGDPIETCANEFALVEEKIKPCFWR